MKDNHEMTDVSEIASGVRNAFQTLENAATEMLNSGLLDKPQALQVRQMRRAVRRIHADAADLGEYVLPEGDPTILSGTS